MQYQRGESVIVRSILIESGQKTRTVRQLSSGERSWLGGMAIGYTGGLGVIILTVFLGMNAGAIPTDVILIIMSVIAAITALQKAGGLDYMVNIAAKILRNNLAQQS